MYSKDAETGMFIGVFIKNTNYEKITFFYGISSSINAEC
jgi:hypothetical protein